MIVLQIFDVEGNEIQTGDLLLIQDDRKNNNEKYLTFYAKTQIINGRIFPFERFSYDRIVKVDSIPDGAHHVPARDDFPEYWVVHNGNLKEVEEQYRDDWRMKDLSFNRNKFYKAQEI